VSDVEAYHISARSWRSSAPAVVAMRVGAQVDATTQTGALPFPEMLPAPKGSGIPRPAPRCIQSNGEASGAGLSLKAAGRRARPEDPEAHFLLLSSSEAAPP
jgi:hypothetical protein